MFPKTSGPHVLLSALSSRKRKDRLTVILQYRAGKKLGFSENVFRFLPRDATERGYATPIVYCPSVRRSVCLSVRVWRSGLQVPWSVITSHRLEFFENNFTADWFNASARADPNMGHLVQQEHPQNWGGIGAGKKTCNISETVQAGTNWLLLRTNRKSYTHFRLVPKSTTLDDLERRIQRLAEVFKCARYYLRNG